MSSLNSRTMPALSCPCWERDVAPLFCYLSSSRTIGDILSWAVERGLGRPLAKNQLAWLSFRGKIRFDVGTARWVRGSDRESLWGSLQQEAG